ncbi:MAG: hypothetical protein EA425_08270 [Puniceicoccaceae bacterium]|nr:MAG: hypothetical protein EA425_08270 [Puniceicoccaceae bacterium]
MKLSQDRKEAFATLLDDPSALVREALLREFRALEGDGVAFLQELKTGQNRLLAHHARRFLSELKFSDPVAELRGFIHSLNYELETGALLISRVVYPDLDIGLACKQLDQIALRCKELAVEPLSPREKCILLNRVLFHELGFRGNSEHYQDPDNSFLNQVLLRRKGIPLTLSLVYILVAQRLGLHLDPVGLPGHFVVGCFLEDVPFYIDPYDRGLLRTPEEVVDLLQKSKVTPRLSDLAPTPIREVLCRCCRNLVSQYQAVGNLDLARLFRGFVEEFKASHQNQAQP